MSHVDGFLVPVKNARLKVCETDPPCDGKRLIFGGFMPMVGLER